MNGFDEMKGRPRRLLSLHRDGNVFHLVKYDDGSLGIQRNERTLAIWESHDEKRCVDTYANLAGLQDSAPAVYILQSSSSVDPTLFN